MANVKVSQLSTAVSALTTDVLILDRYLSSGTATYQMTASNILTQLLARVGGFGNSGSFSAT